MNIVYVLLIATTTLITANNNIELSVSGSQQTKMPIAILVLDKTNNELNAIAEIIKKDLQFTDQFQPRIEHYDANLPKKELRKNMQQLANSGTPLALCLNTQSAKAIDWHLYDTTQCSQLAAKSHKQKGSSNRKSAHAIADQACKTLTGHDPIFSSQIAYCKEAKSPQGKKISKIYIADFNGENEELFINSNSITIAPRWNTQKPELVYSEYTDTSIQLKSAPVKNKRKKAIVQGKNVSHFEDGINMSMNFAPNGNAYTFAASCGNGNCQIYLHKDDKLKRCTKNSGNNDSPILMDGEHLCFCSNFQTGSPQIYIGNILTGHLQRITRGGYCTSPAYCAKTNQIVYHQMIKGIMQIMVYDCATKTHTQLTDNAGNKHESSWSPNGKFLLYSHEGPNHTSRIATLNTLTQKVTYLTKADEYCNYPHWSPCYTTI
jgi:TolB protein